MLSSMISLLHSPVRSPDCGKSFVSMVKNMCFRACHQRTLLSLILSATAYQKYDVYLAKLGICQLKYVVGVVITLHYTIDYRL